jgi:flagellar biosynthesis GTPase FlhF
MARTLKRSEEGTADSAWLKNLVNNPNVRITDNDSGKEVTQNELKDIVEKDDKSPDDTAAQKKTEDLSKKVEDQKDKDASKEERKKIAEQKKKEREEKQKLAEQKRAADEAARKMNARRNAAQNLLGTVNDKLDQPIEKVGHALDVFQAAKTPGGIGFLVILLIFLLWVVVRVDQAGNTRIKQFWYMLNGKANLEPSPAIGSRDFASPTGKDNIASGDIPQNTQNAQKVQNAQSLQNAAIEMITPYLSANTFRVGLPS